MDHHTIATISLIGISLDVLGGLYLAYDLLGGQRGPLRLLTRMVTYSVLFGAGYALGLGLIFGLASGPATGITIALELHRTSGGRDHYALPWESFFSLLRGAAFAFGLYTMVGLRFAVAFGALVTLGQIFAYWSGMRPSLGHSPIRKLRLTHLQLKGSLIRTIGYIVTALMCSAWVQHLEHPWQLALRVGLVTGFVTAIGTMLVPIIEYFADNLPERRLGVFGIILVFWGFAFQSFQYWVGLFDIPVK